ncbi:Rhodanese-related sulfurtransferase [Melghirimyces thermohalophilus]|uniref:Rhodanese-related sulfurtransferase n=1 Tax=Melghirimyces thermohalophilus TaxID=1236220 RepID=A0A1G6LB07_9BACL|nr:Rhodanese-related sulfurtransferase [Melghirimyces thermohalophilus]
MYNRAVQTDELQHESHLDFAFPLFVSQITHTGICYGGVDTAKYQKVTSQELFDRMDRREDLILVDVREDGEVRTGKIPGAKHIPLRELPMRLSELDPNREIVFVCAGGNRSKKACQYVADQGFDAVWNLEGGMKKWIGPVE